MKINTEFYNLENYEAELNIVNKKNEENITIETFNKNYSIFDYKWSILFETIKLLSLIIGLDIKLEENYKIYFLLIKKACFISQKFVNSIKKINFNIDKFNCIDNSIKLAKDCYKKN